MSGYTALQRPATNGAWARDIEDRLAQLENPKTSRIGPWVLVDMGQELMALRPGFPPVTLASQLLNTAVGAGGGLGGTLGVPADVQKQVDQVKDTIWSMLLDALTGKLPTDPTEVFNALIETLKSANQQIAGLAQLFGLPSVNDFFNIGDVSSIWANIPSLTGKWNVLSQIQNALQGINLGNTGSVLQAITQVQEDFAQAIVGLLGNIPFVGSWLQTLASTLLQTIETSAQAIRTATANQQIISTPGSQDPWHALIPGFVNFALGSARDATDVTTITATTARGGFLTPGTAAALSGVSASLRKSGTVSTANFDLYKLATSGSTAGTLTRIWSSSNIASRITSGADPMMLPVDFPAEFGLVSAPLDMFLIVLRMTGTGTITSVGLTSNTTAAPTGYFPTKFGFLRDPSTTPSPDTILPAAATALYSNVWPFVQLNRYPQSSNPGGGPDTPPPVLHQYYDAFNRNPSVNSIRLGNDWVSERNWGPYTWQQNTGYLAIRDNKLQYGPAENGGTYEGREGALYRFQAGSDSVEVEMTFSGPDTQPTIGVITAASDWSNWFGVAITYNKIEFLVGSSFANYTSVKTRTDYSFAPPDQPWQTTGLPVKLTIAYAAAENLYTLFRTDNKQELLRWEDQSHQVSHGPNQRFAGVIATYAMAIQGSPVDDFRLTDTTVGVTDPAAPPPPSPPQPQVNRFINFGTVPDGTISVPGWVGARSGAGSTLPYALGGLMVDTFTGTVAAANYLSTQLTDGARIIWSVMGFYIQAAGTTNSRATLLILQTDFSINPNPDGTISVGPGPEYGPVHIVFDAGGYLVQYVDTSAFGGPVVNIAYHTYPGGPIPAGTLQQVGVTIDVATSTITVLGADGVATPFTYAQAASYYGNYACYEIYDGNPSTDQAVQILYVGADSVVGGRRPPDPVGSIIAYITPAVGALAGGYLEAGVIDVSTSLPFATFPANVTPAGTITAALQAATAALSGGMQTSGTIAGTTQLPQAVFAAAGITAGTMAGTLQRATTAFTGAMQPEGTIVGTTQLATGSFSGGQTQTGTIAGTTQTATAALSGGQTLSGTFDGTLQKPTGAFPGIVGISFTDDFNRADGAIGSNWTNQMAFLLRVLSNIATPDTLSNYAVAKLNTAMSTAKHYAEIKINTVNASDAYLIYVGAKSSAQVIAFIQPNSSIQILTKTTAYNDLTGFANVGTASSATSADGDVFRFELDGTGRVTIKRNGSALTGVSNVDVSSVIGTNGRDVLIAANVGAFTRGIDSFAAGDI